MSIKLEKAWLMAVKTMKLIVSVLMQMCVHYASVHIHMWARFFISSDDLMTAK